MINDRYPTLLQLFSCYFHQDWAEEFDSPDMAIEAFVGAEPLSSINTAEKELKQIIDSGYSDADVLNLLDKLGCYYDPTVDYTSALSWLKDIRDRLSR